MFENLLALLHGKTAKSAGPALSDTDARHAMGALMVRAAKADNAYLFEEISLIDKVLAQRNGLDVVAAARMRAACEALEKDMPATAEVSETLNRLIPTKEREATVLALWHVVFADGIKHDAEDRVLHEIEEVLGIPPAVATWLQAKAESRTP